LQYQSAHLRHKSLTLHCALSAARLNPDVKFTPRLIPTLAAIAMIALTLSLMRWQLGRAEEKATLAALLDARAGLPALALSGQEPSGEPLRYRKLTAAGTWQPERAIFVDNRSHHNATGYYVLVPLQLKSGPSVLVNIGFAARGRDYPRPPAVALPRGEATLAGVGSLPSSRYVELAAGTISGNVWQNFDLARYAKVTNTQPVPIVLLANVGVPGLTAITEVPDTGIDKHRGYAFQWGAMAAAIFIVWIVTNVHFTPRRPATD
jgi:surfeit locus 1 family protein